MDWTRKTLVNESIYDTANVPPLFLNQRMQAVRRRVLVVQIAARIAKSSPLSYREDLP